MSDFSDFYNEGARKLQDKFETRRLADRQVGVLVHDRITEADKAFIERRDMFFLATVDDQGQPSCSYKGGDPGFVRVVDEKTIAFPDYDGNGMFLSLVNVLLNNQVGMLFIDFENPHRFRVHGTASVHEDDPLLDEYVEAQMIVRVTITEMFINCPRYIHRFKKIEHSVYVPQAACETPVPDWKNLDVVQDVLPERDKPKVDAAKKRARRSE